jgi:hypothetical protein
MTRVLVLMAHLDCSKELCEKLLTQEEQEEMTINQMSEEENFSD